MAINRSCLFDGAVSAQVPAEKAASRRKARRKNPRPRNRREGQSRRSTNCLDGDAAKSNEPMTTEIIADEAFFDSNKSMGYFQRAGEGDRSAIQSPVGQAHGISSAKGETRAWKERWLRETWVWFATGRSPEGGPPTRAAGRSEKATYLASTGDVELTGTPRVQQGVNTHVATSPDTVMVINQNGQLTTHGPSRTEIRQEPKDGEEAKTGRRGREKRVRKGKRKTKNPVRRKRRTTNRNRSFCPSND